MEHRWTRSRSRLAPDENGRRDVAWSPDGAALLTANGEGVVRVIDPESGDVTRSLIATRRVSSVYFHRSGPSPGRPTETCS